MSHNLLPEQFRELEPFVNAWALATQSEREKRRSSSTPEELWALYNAMLPRMEEMLTYLNQFSLDGIPEDAQRLFYLTLSLAEIAAFVEFYGGQPKVRNSFEETRFIAVHGDRVV